MLRPYHITQVLVCFAFVTLGSSPAFAQCPNGLCGFAENPCNCPQDCGAQEVGTELSCADSIDNDCDGLIDCGDLDCQMLPVCCPVGQVCGACCGPFLPGRCIFTDVFDCQAQLGTPQGNGTFCLGDLDSDGFDDICDNCPNTPNPGQQDNDNDGLGNACDTCPDAYNPGSGQTDDADTDGVPDACDNCPRDPNGPNAGSCVEPLQNFGNPCLSDIDCDSAPGAGDGLCSTDQEDDDADDTGDACDFFWKDHNDTENQNVPGGYVPDFDQNLDFDGDPANNNSQTGGDFFYCGPTAMANSIWWFHRKFPNEAIVPAGYTNMDLIQDLAQRMATNNQTLSPNGHGADPPILFFYPGTFKDDMESGITSYLAANGAADLLFSHSEPRPGFDLIAEELLRSQDVVLLLGFYRAENIQPKGDGVYDISWTRIGGHFVTVAGFNELTLEIAVSDTDDDKAEHGALGVVRGPDRDHDPDPDTHPPSIPSFNDVIYDHTMHNDEILASHDFFTVGPDIGRGGSALFGGNDPLSYAGAPFARGGDEEESMSDRHLGDAGGTFDPGNTNGPLPPGYPVPMSGDIYTEIESAIFVSPRYACCHPDGSCSDLITAPDVANCTDTLLGPGVSCQETTCGGTCSDGVDNDGDTATDCADSDCANDPDCCCGCDRSIEGNESNVTTRGPACCPFTCADIDGSGGNVNLVDFAAFAVCFNALPSSSTQCACSDLNQDGAINLQDFATLTLIFNGSSTNTLPNCP